MSSVRSFSLSIPDSPDDPSNIVIIPDAPDLPTYHPKFYIQEGMATFLVENSLFKVHHHFLVRESEKFRSIIMRPRSPSEDVIVLSDVTCHEFECLLDFFYNGMHEDYGPTFREWLALLSIATRFGMDKIRQGAISQIENQPLDMDPIEKIMLAELHGIDGWLAPAYAELCQRAEPLQMHEAEKLGLAVTVKLAQAREKYRGYSASPSPYGGPVLSEPTKAMSAVNDVFWSKPVISSDTSPSAGPTYGKKGKKSR